MRQDETCDGYLTPKGTTIIINQCTWHSSFAHASCYVYLLADGILHDPEAYDEPDRFNPERFLSSPVGVKPGVEETGREDLNFGGGKVSPVSLLYPIRQVVNKILPECVPVACLSRKDLGQELSSK